MQGKFNYESIDWLMENFNVTRTVACAFYFDGPIGVLSEDFIFNNEHNYCIVTAKSGYLITKKNKKVVKLYPNQIALYDQINDTIEIRKNCGLELNKRIYQNWNWYKDKNVNLEEAYD